MSTHASVKRHKISVIKSAKDIFSLSAAEAEALANKAGLSLEKRGIISGHGAIFKIIECYISSVSLH